ncbi:MAG: hypothetical protein ABIR82_06035 [Nocardioides sp.]
MARIGLVQPTGLKVPSELADIGYAGLWLGFNHETGGLLMVKENARARMQSGGTQISRRTVARGVAWSVPVVAVATAAPAFASSPGCQPKLVLDAAGSCKCPGNSSSTNPKGYYLKFCVYDDPNCPTTGASTFLVTGVRKKNGRSFVQTPNNCYPATLADATGPVGGCSGAVVRFLSTDSSINLVVDYKVGGIPYTIEVDAPVDCSGVLATDRCQDCTK